MTASTHEKIPAHLRKYIVDQNYARYTPEDQAVWRYIMRQLKSYLSEHAHESYLEGLEKTGISIDRIPSITEIDGRLEKFGWGAVPVSGFIPPAAFMEFQSIGVLPIASDMRTVNHLLYTPAPDIVHEAAGHAPILVHPEYAAYLRQYGEVARHTILSKEDMDQYEAIRILSDIKEDPRSTPAEIAKAERRLNEVNSSMSGVSEAALLSRMNWWTAEYGLIGDLKQPRIFGAGLLSSVGEARSCLNAQVKKIPLSVECVQFSYDITEKQPQLFVANDFAHLGEVLEQLAGQLSYRRGGSYGLEQAKRSGTVNSIELNSGLQASGLLKDFMVDANGTPCFFKLEGPAQLAHCYAELPGQGTSRHAHGFSSPVGLLEGHTKCLSQFSPADLEQAGIQRGQRARLRFQSGIIVEGLVKEWTYAQDRLLVLTWTDCTVTRGSQRLFEPAWGEFDMAVGSQVRSVFGGPADRTSYGTTEDFANKRVPARSFLPSERKRHTFYQEVRDLRESQRTGTGVATEFRKLANAWLAHAQEDWLPGIELVELSYQLGLDGAERKALVERLLQVNEPSVHDGLALAEKRL